MESKNKILSELNLGLWDGQVSHQEINKAIVQADKVILFGEQNRLPYFTEDEPLPKLHAGDPSVLRFWKVLGKLPDIYTEALFERQISVTLVRGKSLLFFANWRRHQALHLGLRRNTVYLPEVLFHEAEIQGYDHWAMAEGLFFACWMLLDYRLLVDIIKGYSQLDQSSPALGLGSPVLLRRLLKEHNLHRRSHENKDRDESEAFVAAYGVEFGHISQCQAQEQDTFVLAHQIFDASRETQWAQYKMECLAEVFNFPQRFALDRDIIHGAAKRIATELKQDIEPQNFAEALHDYRDALRFDDAPLLVEFGRGIVTKPQAAFLDAIVRLGFDGLVGYFSAFAAGDGKVMDLVHLLWKYLCNQSSDPAGVFTRIGRCRALAKTGSTEGLETAVAGVLMRLDLNPEYTTLVAQVGSIGAPAREELAALVDSLQLQDEDEWATFKLKKQGIVLRALELLEIHKEQAAVAQQQLLLARRTAVHEDPRIVALLTDHPHRLTSDPTAVLKYWRAYQGLIGKLGMADPEVNFLLASLLIRMDRSEEYPYFLEQLPLLGPPAVSVLYDVFENMSADDKKRKKIWRSARQVLAGFLLKRNAGTRKKAS